MMLDPSLRGFDQEIATGIDAGGTRALKPESNSPRVGSGRHDEVIFEARPGTVINNVDPRVHRAIANSPERGNVLELATAENVIRESLWFRAFRNLIRRSGASRPQHPHPDTASGGGQNAESVGAKFDQGLIHASQKLNVWLELTGVPLETQRQVLRLDLGIGERELRKGKRNEEFNGKKLDGTNKSAHTQSIELF
jgi:hypothetical protein